MFLDYWNRSGVQYFTIQVSYMGRYSPGIGSFYQRSREGIFWSIKAA